MTWSYSGNPNDSDKDKYRFLLGDTDVEEPILQDEEIQFVITSFVSNDERLYHLYDKAATFFARKIKRTVGPISEEPIERQRYFEEKAKQYKTRLVNANFTVPTTTTIFRKGMHDNV